MVIPGRDWLLQVVALREAVPDEVVPSVLGGRVVVDGGMRDKRTREPTDLPVQDRDRRLNGLAPVVTHGLWGGEGGLCRLVQQLCSNFLHKMLNSVGPLVLTTCPGEEMVD